ncbi:MAG: beta-lactamase family protein [bacterium]|nr:beta-lactamase family protein [bacterium]
MEHIEEYIQTLIDGNIIPGMSLLVGKRHDILLQKHMGFKSLVPSKEPLQEDTLYDLASLTKPLITSFLAIYLLNREPSVNFDTPVKHFHPQLSFDITIKQLLLHTSGLPAWYPFFLFGTNYLDRFPSIVLESRPGRAVNYSCVGYILLRYIIEKIAATPFNDLAQNVIINRLGLKNTFLSVPADRKKDAAPTEKGCSTEYELAEKLFKKESDAFKWRKKMIRGETHDCNSFYLGGCAGNAGLFSTTADVFRLCMEFFPGTATLLPTHMVNLFYRNFTPFKKSHRTAGFKRNSSLITSGGRGLSWKAIGHNGFTGTSLWMDPLSGLIFILLTNRIHPTLTGTGKEDVNFNKIRRKLHKLIAKQLQ